MKSNRFLKSLKMAIPGLILTLPAALSAQTVNTPVQNPDMRKTGSMFQLYEDNRAKSIPNYITADFLLLGYSLVRESITQQFEQDVFIPSFTQWVNALDKAIPTDKKPQSLANKQLSSILLALLNDNKPQDDKRVITEFELIQKAQGISNSPLLYRQIDYSQFKPVGRHAASKTGQQFFRAIRYASTVLLPLLDSKATGISTERANLMFLQAEQMAGLYQKNDSLSNTYNHVAGLLEKRFGASDDLNWQELTSGNTKTETDISKRRLALFDMISGRGLKPRVIADIVDKPALEKNRTVADVVTGFRLFPSFATPISGAFQQLLFDHTGVYKGKAGAAPFTRGTVAGQFIKAFPTAQEILALLGEDDSIHTLAINNDTAYEGYNQAFQKSKSLLASSTGLSRQYLTIIKTLAGTIQRDQSALGFWTWQRYMDQLYVKQSTTPTGKSLNLQPVRAGALLESAPQIYNTLESIVAIELQINPGPAWKSFADLIRKIQQIQWKQSIGSSLTQADENILNNLDTRLLTLTAGRSDHPVAVAVHSNPNSKEKLWEATGLSTVIQQGQARGSLFSHHEFKMPMDKVLDKEGWIELLGSWESKK